MKTAIKQHDLSDCGAAAICSVARHYGQDIPLTRIREASGTDRAGTTFQGMIDACRKLGFEAHGYRSANRDTSLLGKLRTPAILHVVQKNGDLHFIVLYGADKRRVRVMDPALGRHRELSYEEIGRLWSGYLITLSPDPGSTQSHSQPRRGNSFSQYTRLISCVKTDYLRSLPGSFLCVGAGITTSLFLQHIIDTVIPGGSIRELAGVSILLALILLCSALVGYGSSIFALRAGVRMDGNLILNYLRHLFSLPVGFFQRRGAGELNARITDAFKVRSMLTEGLTGITTGALLLAGSFALMFTYWWKLALMTLLFVPLYVAVYLLANHVTRDLNKDLLSSVAEFEDSVIERISAIRTVKYFGRGTMGYGDLQHAFANMNWNMYRTGRALGRFSLSADLLAKLMTLVLLSIGSAFVFRGDLTTGELVSFYALSAWFASPLGEMVSVVCRLNESNVSLERLQDITLLEAEPQGGLEGPLGDPQALTFRDVHFSYPGCGPLLVGFNATFPKGTLTAVIGESGCGKSTLAALLMRDFEVNGGHILWGETDIAQIDLSCWRHYISMVPQDPGLINCSILDNITGGEKDPDLKKVGRILEELQMARFVASLSLGILTPAGEHGSLLSGGQKQRIALARALYRDPQILILDEATAALDEFSQACILRKAAALRDEGRIVIMITHRRDNVAVADRVLDMNQLSAHS